ncbi:hypothetical protein VMCG_10839 [Cytospora schulzeri]|uniref:Uncharacterized protein n=1 Tax=Cytospora schulzeri TaxID=448051 RepID=A0A423V880_9PEZI|nr:hypothetical protein VMCG_10839 [Valsa malicola]
METLDALFSRQNVQVVVMHFHQGRSADTSTLRGKHVTPIEKSMGALDVEMPRQSDVP